jgi:hypothetical protein
MSEELKWIFPYRAQAQEKIEELQNYIDTFPESALVPVFQRTIDEIKEKFYPPLAIFEGG